MKEISCKLLVDRRRAGRLCLRHPCRAARHRYGDRRGQQARRHLPQRGLHPVQGADPCSGRIRQDRPHRERAKRARNSAQHPHLDLAKTIAWKDGIVGRLTDGVVGLAQESGVKVVARMGDLSATGKPSRSRPKPARRSSVPRHIVIATGSAPVSCRSCRSAVP